MNNLELEDKREGIIKVLENSTGSFNHFYSQTEKNLNNNNFNENVLLDVRIDNLDLVLSGLKLALNLLRPSVNEINLLLSDYTKLSNKVDKIRELTRKIEFSNDFLRLSEIENELNNNYLKLKSVETLQFHLNPGLSNDTIKPLMTLDRGNLEEILSLITASEQLKISQQFCQKLQQKFNITTDFPHDLTDFTTYSPDNSTDLTDFTSENNLINKVLRRINEKLERVSELCYEILSKELDRITLMSGRLNADSGVIHEPLINIPYTQDTLHITTLFDYYQPLTSVNTVESVHSIDSVSSVKGVDSVGGVKLGNFVVGVGGTDPVTEKISIRLLKILITNSSKLQQFLMSSLEFLSNLAEKRYSALLKYIIANPKNRDNNAVYDVFMNLQLVISLIKTSVISLYSNCEVDLYSPQHSGLMTAENYIHKVTEILVPLLEHKLHSLLLTDTMDIGDAMGSVDRVDTVDTVVGRGILEIVELYTAIQISHFYYNKISNILKPPYLQLSNSISSSVNTSLEVTLEYTEYTYDNSVTLKYPLLNSINHMCNEWNELIMLKLQKCITVPLSSEDYKGSEEEILRLIANFLSEIVSIQLEYSVSNDLITILEMTINPVINWCQRIYNSSNFTNTFNSANSTDNSSNLSDNSLNNSVVTPDNSLNTPVNSVKYGDIFLLNAYSLLLSSIQSPLVDKSFKLLLEELRENAIDSIVNHVIPQVITALGGKFLSPNETNRSNLHPNQLINLTNLHPNEPINRSNLELDDVFFDNVKSVIFTDGVMELVPQLGEQFSKLEITNLKLVLKRIYLHLAKLYQTHLNDDTTLKLITLANTYS